MPLDPSLTKFTTVSQSLVSYDFQDIQTGEAIVSYYAATNKVETTTSYLLTGDSSIYSNDEQQSEAIDKDNDTTFRIELDLDFDLSPFKIAQTFEGEATIQVTFGCSQGYTSDSNGVYIIFKVRKWDGTTETEIASAQTETWDDGKGSTLKTALVPITIPATTFAVGETLRLTVETWTMLDSSISNGTMFVKHDPANRNGTSSNPNFLKLNMPQRLEL